MTNTANTVWPKIFALLRGISITLLGMGFVYLVGYAIIYHRAYSFTGNLTSTIYWVTSEVRSIVAFTVAAAVTAPVLWSIAKLLIGQANRLQFLIAAVSAASTVASAYLLRHQYFAPDRDPVFVCAPVLPDDPATLEHLGQGEAEGRRCIRITPQNAAAARAVERSRAPKQVFARSVAEANDIAWFKNGAPAVYLGEGRAPNGLPKLYDGPGFDPDSPFLLAPITLSIVNEYRARLIELEQKEVARQREESKIKTERAEKEKKEEEQKRMLEAAAREEVARKSQAEIATPNSNSPAMSIDLSIIKAQFGPCAPSRGMLIITSGMTCRLQYAAQVPHNGPPELSWSLEGVTAYVANCDYPTRIRTYTGFVKGHSDASNSLLSELTMYPNKCLLVALTGYAFGAIRISTQQFSFVN